MSKICLWGKKGIKCESLVIPTHDSGFVQICVCANEYALASVSEMGLVWKSSEICLQVEGLG